jgi:hypothetical protein
MGRIYESRASDYATGVVGGAIRVDINESTPLNFIDKCTLFR